ncbi:hypothetical protein K502DRAFT_353979 [Neoconidiobolus thromboides FSU 785]|nr:hypothetical protein K502DRAFT_353979 [Neoconidiobolus thromboides FSU 785]
MVQNFRLFRGSRASIDATRSIKVMVFRILLYPIVMIIANIGIVINQVAYDLGNIDSSELRIFGNITVSTLGTLNFIAFFCDPTIHSAFRKICLRYATQSEFCDSSSKLNGVNYSDTVNIESLGSGSTIDEEEFNRGLEKFTKNL